jgi:predicted nucleic acid-binding protein
VQPADGTETLVLDCSLAMAWYFRDEATPYTTAVRTALATERVVVPSLWALEITNVLIVAERRKRSTQAKASKWLRLLAALPIFVDGETAARAFDPVLSLARAHKLTAYDAAYLELAMRRGLPLATLDDDLKKAAQTVGVPLYVP